MTTNFKFKGHKLKLTKCTKLTVDDRRSRIFLSPFGFEKTYATFPNVNYNNKGINLKYVNINALALYTIFPHLPRVAIGMLMAILNNLEPDTNIVIFNKREYARNINRDYENINVQSKALYDHNIICRTDKLFTFMINHNIFFKGNLEQFRKDYYDLYGDKEAEFNDKGCVILKNY